MRLRVRGTRYAIRDSTILNIEWGVSSEATVNSNSQFVVWPSQALSRVGESHVANTEFSSRFLQQQSAAMCVLFMSLLVVQRRPTCRSHVDKVCVVSRSQAESQRHHLAARR